MVVVIDDPSTASVINGRNKMYQVIGGGDSSVVRAPDS